MEDVEIIQTFTRICPKCNEVLHHTSERYCIAAKKRNKVCKLCSYQATRDTTQSEQWRAEQSERLKSIWDDENSVYNSPEYREKLHIAQSNRTPEAQAAMTAGIRRSWEEERANPTGRIERFHANNNLPEARLKRIASLKKSYQEHPELREAQSKRAKEWMLNPEYKRKCTEKLIEAAQRTGGCSKKERELALILSQFGIEHKRKVGKWYPDFYHTSTNTAIEYYGDWWHCHPRYDERIENSYNGVHPNCGLTPQQIRQNDEDRINEIKMLCSNVIILWENDIIIDGKLNIDIIKDKLSTII